MRRPPITSNTLYALQATEYAKEHGKFEPFHLELYRAYWEDGKDLGKLDVIKEAAERCELPWHDLKARLESGHYEQAVMGQYQEAMELGIRGIPAFLIGNFLFTGARPYEIFQSVMGKVLEQERPSSSS